MCGFTNCSYCKSYADKAIHRINHEIKNTEEIFNDFISYGILDRPEKEDFIRGLLWMESFL